MVPPFEFDKDSTWRGFCQVQTEGSRKVTRKISSYNLDVIISVGYRVKSPIGVEFRKWVTQKLKEYLVKGYSVNSLLLQKEQSRIIELRNQLNSLSEELIETQKMLTDGEEIIQKMLKEEPTGQYTRRAWFLYEWLMEKTLDVPDLKKGTYVEVVDSSLQFTGQVKNSTRHRVKNNLPGVPSFCPMVRKIEKLEQYIGKDIFETIEKGLGKRDKDLIRRTAAFLLLKDSKASFAIEGEYPPNMRARNWGKAIGQSGKVPDLRLS